MIKWASIYALRHFLAVNSMVTYRQQKNGRKMAENTRQGLVAVPQLLNEKKIGAPMETFDHIQLTPEEAEEALRLARRAKAGRIAQQEYWAKINTPPVIPVLTAEQLLAEVLARAAEMEPEFIQDQYSERALWLMCLWHTNDARFETAVPGFKLNRGNMVLGNVGCGKTLLMRLFQDTPRQAMVVLPTREIVQAYVEGNLGGLDKYKYEYTSTMRKSRFGHTEYGICFDDLGLEEVSKHYGQSLDVMAHVLLHRYDYQDLHALTHVTTNLNGQEFEARFGTRLYSRAKEMFNIIKFGKDAPDRREQKNTIRKEAAKSLPQHSGGTDGNALSTELPRQ